MKAMTHIETEQLERYACGRFGEPAAAEVEEHLLACPACREELAGIDEFVEALRGAVEAEKPARAKVLVMRAARRPWIWAPLAAAAALVLAVGLTYDTGRAPLEPALVVLQPLRDESGTAAERGRPLRLQMEVQGGAGAHDVEIVDAHGGRVLRASGTVEDGKLVIAAPGFRSGDYWVRIYPAGERNDIVSEYRLRVR
jgi:anti-sigma factor RsiW